MPLIQLLRPGLQREREDTQADVRKKLNLSGNTREQMIMKERREIISLPLCFIAISADRSWCAPDHFHQEMGAQSSIIAHLSTFHKFLDHSLRYAFKRKENVHNTGHQHPNLSNRQSELSAWEHYVREYTL